MSKRKPATVSKRARSNREPATAPKGTRRQEVVAQAQRNRQDFVRSGKESPLRSVVGSAESANDVVGEPKQETPIVDNRARAVALEAMLQASLQNDLGQKTRDNNPKTGIYFSLPLANMQACQAKLLEAAQAEMQFAFEFIRELVTIRSPFEFWAIVAVFAGRHVAMIGTHSKDLAACWRIEPPEPAVLGR